MKIISISISGVRPVAPTHFCAVEDAALNY